MNDDIAKSFCDRALRPKDEIHGNCFEACGDDDLRLQTLVIRMQKHVPMQKLRINTNFLSHQSFNLNL